MASPDLLTTAAVLLGIAIVAVPIAKRLGLGVVLGYLLAGVAVGPWGLAVVADPQAILEFSEFGVVLLLFLIGLELEPKRLWQMRARILGMGSAQMLLTALALMLLGRLCGWGWPAALIGGLALALSSTAIALKPLQERGLMNTAGGNATFSVLLFQDIAVIPILALIPLLAVNPSGAQASNWVETGKAIAVVITLILAGRFLLPRVFHYIAKTGLREIFTAFSLFLVVGVGVLMHAVELSMALGAFLSGVLLAESEYKHELESNLEPFKALLLGLFFLSVGMSVDFGLAMTKPFVTFAMVLALLGVKILIHLAIARVGGIPAQQRGLFALLLAGGGEFAFVVAQLASQRGVMAGEDARLIVIAVALSMLIAPLLLAVFDRWTSWQIRQQSLREPEHESVPDERMPVLIAGFGRVGQVVARVMHAHGYATTIMDCDPDRIEIARRFGFKVYYGDATRAELLETAGVANAKLIVLAIDDRDATTRMAELLHKRYPLIPVVIRAWDMSHVWALMDQGARHIHKECFLGSLAMASDCLKQLGASEGEAQRTVQLFVQHDQEVITALYGVHKDGIDAQAAVSKRLRDEIEAVFQADKKIATQTLPRAAHLAKPQAPQ
jgi:glutathione-regulated potassium-efflux system ancillary protein KefC